jgi:hypothetical protein
MMTDYRRPWSPRYRLRTKTESKVRTLLMMSDSRQARDPRADARPRTERKPRREQVTYVRVTLDRWTERGQTTLDQWG